jgi:hypothetical protein
LRDEGRGLFLRSTLDFSILRSSATAEDGRPTTFMSLVTRHLSPFHRFENL